MAELLALRGVEASYGSGSVLSGVDLAVAEGEVAVLLGANGAGKTTTLRTVMGLLRPTSGEILFGGDSITRVLPERLVGRGIGLVPEPPGVFRDMTVAQNLRVGAFARHDEGDGQLDQEQLLARFPVLEQRRHQRAGSLSGGEQRMLSVARALMGSPRLLLVDEVSMGLAPTAVRATLRLIGGLRDLGVTVLMVEQNVAALDIADRAYVMEKGTIVHEAAGDLTGVRAAVTQAYLGGEDAA